MSALKATALLSGTSLLSILLSLVSAKVMALFLKPAGYGYYGVLQSFVSLTSLGAGMSVATGLVRLGAGAAARSEEQTLANLRGGAWLLLGSLSGLFLILCTVFRSQVSSLALGSVEQGMIIPLLVIATFFTAATNIQAGVLNAYHRVKTLAKSSVLGTMLSSIGGIICVSIWGINGAILATIIGAVATFAVSRYFLRRDIGNRKRASWSESLSAARSLLRFGGPYTASLLVSTGVQLAMPMLILHLLSTESVGYYKAATAISVGYLGFLVTAMGQDYYPRIAAVSDDPRALAATVNEQHRLVMILAAPIILGTLAVVPYLVPIVYSSKFLPTVEILEWQLIGDLFKFSSWTMSFVILARCKSSVLLLTESAVGVTVIAITWGTVRIWGLPALGIGFLLSYIVYYAIVSVIIRREIPFALTSGNKKMMLAAVTAAMIVRVLPMIGLGAYRTPVALCLAGIATVFGLFWIRRELSRPQIQPEAVTVPAGA